MVNMYEVIKTYEEECFEASPAERKAALDKANEALKGTGIYLNPDKNAILPSEAAVVCEDVKKITGYAMLDTGTGTLDKVLIENGHTVTYNNGGFEVAYVIIGNIMYKVENGTELVYHGEVKAKK